MQNLSVNKIKELAGPILPASAAKRAALPGSFVQGEATKSSDIDILVESPNGMGLLDVIRLKQKLEDTVGRSVDLVEYDAIKPRLRPYILSNSV